MGLTHLGRLKLVPAADDSGAALTASGSATVNGTLNAAGALVLGGTLDAAGDVQIAASKAIVLEGQSGAHTVNRQAGWVTVSTGGSAALANSLIKSANTVIALTARLNPTGMAFPCLIKGTQTGGGAGTAGSVRIGLFKYTGTASVGRVDYVVYPES